MHYQENINLQLPLVIWSSMGRPLTQVTFAERDSVVVFLNRATERQKASTGHFQSSVSYTSQSLCSVAPNSPIMAGTEPEQGQVCVQDGCAVPVWRWGNDVRGNYRCPELSRPPLSPGKRGETLVRRSALNMQAEWHRRQRGWCPQPMHSWKKVDLSAVITDRVARTPGSLVHRLLHGQCHKSARHRQPQRTAPDNARVKIRHVVGGEMAGPLFVTSRTLAY